MLSIYYIFLFVIFTVGMFFFEWAGRKPVWLLYLAGLVVALTVGLRSEEIGIDTANYYYLYDQVLVGYKGTWMERKLGPLFIYLSLVSDRFGAGVRMVTLVYSFLTMFFIVAAIKRFSVSYSLSFAIFLAGFGLFFFMHNVMRQALAVAIVFYSVKYIYGRSALKFTVVSVLAILVHYSAIVILPFYYLARIWFRPLYFFFGWIISLFFLFNHNLIVGMIDTLAFFIPGIYIHYLESERFLSFGGSTGVGLGMLLKQCFFVVFLIGYGRQYKENARNELNGIIYFFGMLSLILGNVVLGLGVLGRFAEYFLVFLILAIPLAITDVVKVGQKKFSVACMLLILFGLYAPAVLFGELLN